MSKHTPGPHVVSSSILVCSQDGKILANCAPALGTDLGVDMEEAAANATLYAAASELLDHLQRLIADVEGGWDDPHTLRHAKEAVVEATGQASNASGSSDLESAGCGGIK